MKISIVTVVRNAETTIEESIQSVMAQAHPEIEHILIDGGSSDGTMHIVNRYREHFAHIVSEPDDGIYDAMNKGIQLADGEVLGILNADDVYQDDGVLSQVAAAHEDQLLDACYADLVYVKQNDATKIVRNWKSRNHQPGLSFTGWMPAHPTLFLKRRVYEKAGLFNTELRYQADLEFCARVFEVYKIRSRYIPKLWVRMRMGGVTNNSFRTIWKGNWESYQALKQHGLRSNPLSYFFVKFANRIPQYWT